MDLLKKAEQSGIEELREVAKTLILKKTEAHAQEIEVHSKEVGSGIKSYFATSPIQLLSLAGPILAALIDKADKGKEMGVVSWLVRKQSSSIRDQANEIADQPIKEGYDKAYQIRIDAQRRVGELNSLSARDIRRLINRLYGQEPIEKILGDRWSSWPQGGLVSRPGASDSGGPASEATT